MNLTYSCLPIEPIKLHQMSMKFMQNLTVTRSWECKTREKYFCILELEKYQRLLRFMI